MDVASYSTVNISPGCGYCSISSTISSTSWRSWGNRPRSFSTFKEENRRLVANPVMVVIYLSKPDLSSAMLLVSSSLFLLSFTAKRDVVLLLTSVWASSAYTVSSWHRTIKGFNLRIYGLIFVTLLRYQLLIYRRPAWPLTTDSERLLNSASLASVVYRYCRLVRQRLRIPWRSIPF